MPFIDFLNPLERTLSVKMQWKPFESHLISVLYLVSDYQLRNEKILL